MIDQFGCVSHHIHHETLPVYVANALIKRVVLNPNGHQFENIEISSHMVVMRRFAKKLQSHSPYAARSLHSDSCHRRRAAFHPSLSLRRSLWRLAVWQLLSELAMTTLPRPERRARQVRSQPERSLRFPPNSIVVSLSCARSEKSIVACEPYQMWSMTDGPSVRGDSGIELSLVRRPIYPALGNQFCPAPFLREFDIVQSSPHALIRVV
jgi:hypothetical protein